MPSTLQPARVRFAPSPTGHTHLASGRTALYNFLLARQTGGQFILRIEDTDQKRYVPGAEVELMESLHWLGLDWDEGPDVGGAYGPYRQTERREIYQDFASKLIKTGHAYYCFCTPERLEQVRQEQQKTKQPVRYDGLCRRIDPREAETRVANGERHVIRFKMPLEGSTTAHDFLRGDIIVDNRNLEDNIIVRSDGLALYHLAAIVDDHLMRITHVFRGNEWLATFPLHVQIIRAFGWEEPVWVHLSLFLNPSGKGKMSKRNSGNFKSDGSSFFLKDLEAAGYLPEAVVNWVALMGWSYDDHTEVFNMQDLIEKFSLDHLNPAPAAINYSKLDHFNGLYIRSLAVEDLAARIQPFLEKSGFDVKEEVLLKVAPIIQVRIATLDEAPEMAGFFFKEEVNPPPEDLVGQNMAPTESAEAARRAYEVLEKLPEINHDTAEEPLRLLAEELGLKAGQLFGILRSAVTGQRVSPPLFDSMAIIGKQKVLERIEKAVHVLDQIAKIKRSK
jgi:glutamyl-tRNA synthetase